MPEMGLGLVTYQCFHLHDPRSGTGSAQVPNRSSPLGILTFSCLHRVSWHMARAEGATSGSGVSTVYLRDWDWIKSGGTPAMEKGGKGQRGVAWGNMEILLTNSIVRHGRERSNGQYGEGRKVVGMERAMLVKLGGPEDKSTSQICERSRTRPRGDTANLRFSWDTERLSRK